MAGSVGLASDPGRHLLRYWRQGKLYPPSLKALYRIQCNYRHTNVECRVSVEETLGLVTVQAPRQSGDDLPAHPWNCRMRRTNTMLGHVIVTTGAVRSRKPGD